MLLKNKVLKQMVEHYGEGETERDRVNADSKNETCCESVFKRYFPKTMKRKEKIQKKATGIEVKLRILIALYQMLQGIGGSGS